MAQLSITPSKPIFRKTTLPTGQVVFVPDDIHITLPRTSEVSRERLHLLAYIPWDERYLQRVPAAYHELFRYVLPHLHARTTDVHTALSASLVPELIAATTQPLDQDLLYASVILHDNGWSILSTAEIANSLDYSALAYSDTATRPKELHATLGSRRAHELLADYTGHPRLSGRQQRSIADIVYYHDQIRLWDEEHLGAAPLEYWLAVDADRLWSYTHENFWLDTIRKHTPAPVYVEALARNVESYFLTEQGRGVACRLIAERLAEVGHYPSA
jgi:hypothetical protein